MGKLSDLNGKIMWYEQALRDLEEFGDVIPPELQGLSTQELKAKISRCNQERERIYAWIKRKNEEKKRQERKEVKKRDPDVTRRSPF